MPLSPEPALGQSDSTRIIVVGTVVDPLRKPIEGAEIRVVGGSESTMSSATGSFRLFATRSKEVLLQIRRPGYNAQLLRLTDGWTGTVLLQPGAYKLPEVQVTARYAKPVQYAGTAKYDDYFRRKRVGFGQFISREEIERRAPLRTVDLFQGQAGIKAVLRPPGTPGGTVVSFARCNEFPPKINVYVDGRRLIPNIPPPSMSAALTPGEQLRMMGRDAENEIELSKRREVQGMVGEMLDRVDASDIELIEIYRGPGELPGELNDGNCGAIAIWTRQGGR